MMGGCKQETRGTPSYMCETARFQQPLSHDLPSAPLLIMMAVANTYGCYCCSNTNLGTPGTGYNYRLNSSLIPLKPI